MTFQLGTTQRTNMVTQIGTTLGASGTFKIFSGAEPANCAAADPSGLLLTFGLPSTPFTNAAGVATLAGTWSGTAAASGVMASFRVYDSSAVCELQGTVTNTGSGGDMTVSNTNIASGQTFSVTTFTVTMGNS